MRRSLTLFLFLVLVSVFASHVVAQEAPSVETLRAQLLDAQAKESELQARERQLDEDLKPENIEHSLAGIGSTRPEELRESRRRQLTIERDGVRAQLRLVSTSRERLEAVIRTAETQAYQQSSLNQAVIGTRSWNSYWVIGTLLAVGEILGIVVLLIVAMKRARTT